MLKYLFFSLKTIHQINFLKSFKILLMQKLQLAIKILQLILMFPNRTSWRFAIYDSQPKGSRTLFIKFHITSISDIVRYLSIFIILL